MAAFFNFGAPSTVRTPQVTGTYPLVQVGDGISYYDIIVGNVDADNGECSAVFGGTPNGSVFKGALQDSDGNGIIAAGTINGVVNFGSGLWQFQSSTSSPSANVDNYNPTNGVVARLNPSTNINLTGIVANGASNGRILIIQNASANIVTIKHDVTSTAANRFYCPGNTDYSLTARKCVMAVYDFNNQRWHLAG